MAANQEQTSARVLVASHRSIYPDVSWASGYEFEDVICEVDSAELLAFEYQPLLPSKWGDKLARQLKRRVGLDIRRSPTLRPKRLMRDYDLLFVHVGGVQDLEMLNSIDGWKIRCRLKACWIEELWPDWLRYTKMLEALKAFDHVFIAHAGIADQLGALIDRPCTFLPPAVDALRFCPFPDRPARTIDFYAMGRRSGATHLALLNRATADPHFHYLYDSARWGTFTSGHVQHRHLTANLAKRSRYFLAHRAKANRPEETQGAQVFGPRFFEGVAAGAIIIGDAPNCSKFRDCFDWPDAIFHLPFGSDQVCTLLDQLDQDPERLSTARRLNATNALLRHDWTHRWCNVLKALSLERLPPADSRLAALRARAAHA
jgi:Glycosyl transferases group 1